jgi:outer membrane protein assembly factor BamB
VVGSTVYIGSLDHNLYALRAGTGKKLWSFTLPNPVEASPAFANGIVYTGEGSDGPGLFALQASTGKRLWGVSTNGTVIGSPAVSGGEVYFDSVDGRW